MGIVAWITAIIGAAVLLLAFYLISSRPGRRSAHR